jgi:hypothetical protein
LKVVAGEDSMADYVKYLMKPSQGLLDPDETLLGGAPCLPRGAIGKRALGSVFGVAGNAVAGAAAASGYGDSLPPLPSVIALGVSSKRLLVFGMGGFRGRPRDLLYSTLLSQVVGIAISQGRSVGIKKTQLDITLQDGSQLALEVAIEHSKHARKVAEALIGLGVPISA